MIAYVDSSVLIRIVLREPNPLAEWPHLDDGITSALTRLEAARVVDRLRLLRAFDENGLADKRREVADILRRLDYITLDDQILEEAAKSLPVVLGALDAIHLASAVLYRAAQPPHEQPIAFATHDISLARAARAVGFDVIGAPA